MKSKQLLWGAQIGVLVLAASIGALAQDRDHHRLSGVINAYSPQTTSSGISTGPYEIRGPWSLKLKGDSGKADFSAALNMELSDGWVMTPTGGNGNFDPAGRGAHTHHITLADADVAPIPGGFKVSGMATITVNGKSAPVSPSFLEVDITGDVNVEFSNITLTFGAPASKHFGAEALPGVVVRGSNDQR